MIFGGALPIAGALGSKLFGKKGGGYDPAIAAQERMFNIGRADLSPYREFGEGELKNLMAFLSSPEGRFRAPTMDEAEQTPGYQFRLGEGKRAIENSAIARGGLLSGNTARDILGFGQDYASGEYDKVYGRREREYGNELAKRMGFVNLGYGAAGGSANLAANQGNTLANLYARKGEADTERSQFPWKIGGSILGGWFGSR